MPNIKAAVTGQITVNGGAVIASLANCLQAGIQITGIWTGTLTIKSSVDGVNYNTFGMKNNADGVITSAYTANGQAFSSEVGGFTSIEVVATAAMTGAAVITIVGS